MQYKKDLAKIALAALILASVSPINGEAVTSQEVTGTFLAAGCGNGCGGTSSPSTTNQNNSNDSYSNPNSYKSNRRNASEGSGEYRGNSSNYDSSSNDDQNKRSAVASPSFSNLTEAQLLVALNAQGRAIYLSLDPEGKALAIQLASQDSYRDKNLAIKEAQRRSNERQEMKR